MASSAEGQCYSARPAAPNHWYGTRIERPEASKTPKPNPEACGCAVDYNAQVDRRVRENGTVQDLPTDRQKTRFRDSKRLNSVSFS